LIASTVVAWGTFIEPAPRIGSAAAWDDKKALRPVGVSVGWCSVKKSKKLGPSWLGRNGNFMV
jgi:hypothetical protein